MNVYVDGVKQGGGGAVLPDTPAAVLLDAATPNSLVTLDASGVGSTQPLSTIPTLPASATAVLADSPGTVVVIDPAGDGAVRTYSSTINQGMTEQVQTGYPPGPTGIEGTTLIFDGVAGPLGSMKLTSPDVSAFLKAANLPFTSVIDAKEHITNNGNSHDLLSVNCGTANRGYILRFTVGASNATTWQAGVSWDIIAAVTHDGAVTIRNAVITKSDPASLWTVTLSTSGNNVKLVVTGQAGTNVAWFAGGFLTIYDGVNP